MDEVQMLQDTKPTSLRRHNKDGSIDSICTLCLATFATVFEEEDLALYESEHVCNPTRLFQLNGRSPRRFLNGAF